MFKNLRAKYQQWRQSRSASTLDRESRELEEMICRLNQRVDALSASIENLKKADVETTEILKALEAEKLRLTGKHIRKV